MADYRLSKLADADLAGIANYTLDAFGLTQARIYRDRLLGAFEKLAAFPEIGSDCGHLRQGVRRFEHESHVIYFRARRGGILILRILARQQNPSRHI